MHEVSYIHNIFENMTTHVSARKNECLQKFEDLELNEAYEDMKYLRFSNVILRLKVDMMITENFQNCGHLQGNEHFGSYEISHCSN
jgi:hypothetical protein